MAYGCYRPHWTLCQGCRNHTASQVSHCLLCRSPLRQTQKQQKKRHHSKFSSISIWFLNSSVVFILCMSSVCFFFLLFFIWKAEQFDVFFMHSPTKWRTKLIPTAPRKLSVHVSLAADWSSGSRAAPVLFCLSYRKGNGSMSNKCQPMSTHRQRAPWQRKKNTVTNSNKGRCTWKWWKEWNAHIYFFSIRRHWINFINFKRCLIMQKLF